MKAPWIFPWRSAAVVVEPLRAAHVEACAAIHAGAFHRGWGADEIAALLADASVVSAAATSANKLLGFVLSRRAVDEAEILTIAVAAGARGKGVGRALLNDHLAALDRLGVARVYLEVDAGNAAALALYARAGFARVGERKGYYATGGGKPATALILKRGA